MFRPAIQKTGVLVGLALFNILLFFWASKSTVVQKAQGYELKIQAAELMEKAMKVLKENRMGKSGIFIDSENDPNETALVGSQFSLITTDEGNLDSKLTTLNPNFAALIVDMLLDAGVESGDKVAVAFTGSMPGANLATLAAIEIMELNPVIVTSAGASQWGATNPYFTWLDMEKILYDEAVFHHRTIAASIGGKGDTGKGLSIRGRELLWEAIYRNDIMLIQENNLMSSIDKRIEIFSDSESISNYAVYINIGGGAASIGPSINAKLIPGGISFPRNLIDLTGESVLKNFSKSKVPVIHILQIKEIAEAYDFPYTPIPMPPIGTGTLFSELQYNFTITLITLALAIGAVTAVGIKSHRQIKRRMTTYEPESIL
ncbi:MAG: poly-gamma-glutamate system protein [Candidatus Marinimicrobia bacterium]|nr:poly-gamma-glutamate system protein [Candidatus Neomarinimicrobiota bacterium]